MRLAFRVWICILVAQCIAVPASAQQLAGGSSPDISIIRILMAMIICSAAAFGLVVVLRLQRKMPPIPHLNLPGLSFVKVPLIEVLEARRLSPHADISLIRHGNIEYLLLCGASGLQVLNTKVVGSLDEEATDAPP